MMRAALLVAELTTIMVLPRTVPVSMDGPVKAKRCGEGMSPGLRQARLYLDAGTREIFLRGVLRTSHEERAQRCGSSATSRHGEASAANQFARTGSQPSPR